MTAPLPGSRPTESDRARNKREHPTAHRIELAGQIGAGAVGSAFGAAKLRDAHREQYPARHTAGVKRAVRIARAKGASPQQAARLAHVLHAGKPGFKSLVAVTAAGSVATAAHRSAQIQDAVRHRREQVAALAKSEPRRAATPITQHLRVPVYQARHARRPYVGKRRVLSPVDKVKAQAVLHSAKLHTIAEQLADLGKADTGRVAGRGPLASSTHPGGITVTQSAFGVEHGALSKADKDHRGAKYAGAAYGGAVGGGLAARQVAARSAGMKVGDVTRLATEHAQMHVEREMPKIMAGMDHSDDSPGRMVANTARAGFRAARGAMKAAHHSVPGYSRIVRANKVGMPAGAAAGVAAVAAARHKKKHAAAAAPSTGSTTMAKSAFGIDHHISKADTPAKPNAKPSAGRVAAGTAFGPYHAAVAGKKGKKLAAVGSSVGHQVGGSILGGAAGMALTRGKSPGAAMAGSQLGAIGGAVRSVYSNSAKGRYKPEQ